MSQMSLQGEGTEVTKPLRVCRVCGLEAWTEEDLELFTKDPSCTHGRNNLCKLCWKKYLRRWHKENPLSGRYRSMMHRCYDPKKEGYHNYGGRGITVCEEWRNDRQAFIDWAKANGFKPELQIDRIDNDGPYAPWNCRWVTRSQQNLNRRDTVTFLEKGTRICWKCKIEKPFSEFNLDKTIPSRYGYSYRCKDCNKKYMKEYRERKNKP